MYCQLAGNSFALHLWHLFQKRLRLALGHCAACTCCKCAPRWLPFCLFKIPLASTENWSGQRRAGLSKGRSAQPRSFGRKRSRIGSVPRPPALFPVFARPTSICAESARGPQRERDSGGGGVRRFGVFGAERFGSSRIQSADHLGRPINTRLRACANGIYEAERSGTNGKERRLPPRFFAHIRLSRAEDRTRESGVGTAPQECGNTNVCVCVSECATVIPKRPATETPPHPCRNVPRAMHKYN